MVELDYCPKCMGVWFDDKELQELLPSAAENLKIPRKAVKLKISCPRCEKFLYSFHYPNTTVTVEMCKKCKGLWLDCAEFQQIRIEREYSASTEELEKKGLKAFLAKFVEILSEGAEGNSYDSWDSWY
jgi:Zn-finger nucleic acid-binding protein